MTVVRLHFERIARVDEFEALVRSLGEHLVDYVGRTNLQRLTVAFDESTRTAHADVCLASEDFDSVMRAIEKIGEVRLLFLDEVSLEYVLLGPSDCVSRDTAPSRELVFA